MPPMTARPAHAEETGSKTGMDGSRVMPGTLLDLCEPLFLYICRVNRSMRMTNGTRYQSAQVAAEVKSLLAKFERDSRGAGLELQFHKVRMPLMFFVDHFVITSTLPFAGEWKRLAHEKAEFAGDEKFFELLDADLADPDPAATERLMIFYVCLGLGFTGKLADNRTEIDSCLARTAARLGQSMDSDEAMRLCPDAYHHTLRRPIAEPVARPLLGIGLVAIVLVAVALALNIALYLTQTSQLRNALERFNQAFPVVSK
jgi:type VI protein secretion system component VasF